ncbi:hypothetical protein ACET94_21095, partial [Aeromonas veronii]
MKKIVISSNTSWSIFNFRLELVRFLAKDYQVEIIAPRDQYSEKLRKLGFVVHDIKMASSREFNFEVQFPIKNQAAFRSSSKTT